MARETIQTTVQLQPYHVAGIKAIEEKYKSVGRVIGRGLMSELIRRGLERVFREEGITDDDIKANLSDS